MVALVGRWAVLAGRLTGSGLLRKGQQMASRSSGFVNCDQLQLAYDHFGMLLFT